MTWSYSGDPGSSNLDHVRFLLGDTNSSDPQLSNEEINFLLSENSDNVYAAATMGARALVSKFSRMVDKEIGDLKYKYSDLVKHYISLIDQWKRKAALSNITITAGGVFKSTGEADRSNSAILQPDFVSDQFDNPAAGRICPED